MTDTSGDPNVTNDTAAGDDQREQLEQVAPAPDAVAFRFKTKPGVDWELIQRQYRAGSMSVAQISRAHGPGPDGKPLISEAGIKKRAKRMGWQRNLSHQIRNATEARLSRPVVTPPVSDEAVIEEGSSRQLRVIESHAMLAQLHMDLGLELAKQLQDYANRRDELAEAVEIETMGDKSMKRRADMLRAIGIHAQVGSYKTLTSALKDTVGIHRLSVGLKNEPTDEGSGDAFVTQLFLPDNGRDDAFGKNGE